MCDGNVPANENMPAANDARTRVPGNENDPAFANDLLRGAEQIAEFMFGDAAFRRRVYYLAATSKLPVFKLGSMVCARKSVLLKWVEEQEGRRA